MPLHFSTNVFLPKCFAQFRKKEAAGRAPHNCALGFQLASPLGPDSKRATFHFALPKQISSALPEGADVAAAKPDVHQVTQLGHLAALPEVR